MPQLRSRAVARHRQPRPALPQLPLHHFGSADDEIYPGLFEKSLRLFAQHPQAAYCCTIGDWHELATGFNWYVSVGIADGLHWN